MKYINPNNCPESWVNAVKSLHYDVDRTDLNIISVTDIPEPPRIRILRARHWDEIELDVLLQDDKVLGSALHYIVTKAQNKDYIIGGRKTITIQGRQVTGEPDLYHIPTQTLEDYKTAKAFTYVFGMDKWEKQLNLYRYLLYKADNLKVKQLKIIAYFKDWSSLNFTRYSEDYPKQALLTFSISKWPLDYTEKYIKSRVTIHKTYENTPDDQLPLCTQEERYSQPDIWAIHKIVNKDTNKISYSAVPGGLCKSREEAEDKIKEFIRRYPKRAFKIQYRKGTDKRCENPRYCDVRLFCNYWRKHYAAI